MIDTDDDRYRPVPYYSRKMILFFPTFAPDTCDFRMISIECIKQIITSSPGLLSKDIAKLLTKQQNTRITKEQINKKYNAVLHTDKFDITWPGIYMIAGITHTDFRHYPAIIIEPVLDDADADDELVLDIAPLAIADVFEHGAPKIKARLRPKNTSA
jgi:hypothetical protein